jgi:hypothetical protein
MQQAEFAMHVPLQLLVPVPQLHAPPTHMPPAPQLAPAHVLSAQSALVSQLLSTPSSQISFAPPHGMFTIGMPIWFDTKVTPWGGELDAMTTLQFMPPFARPTSRTSLGSAIGDGPI